MDWPVSQRLAALWDHLGLRVAHVATQVPADVADFSVSHPDRIASLVFCVPTRLDPAPFMALAARILMIAGETGPTVEVTARAARTLPGSARAVLAGYDAPGWADVVADRPDDIFSHMLGLLGQQADSPRHAPPAGAHAGITYAVQGEGPALVLLPFFLAPSQWDPIIPRLARHFTVITLGGPHIGGVAALEDRARAPSYQGMIRTLFDVMAPQPGEIFLDVGCGSGALDRMLARRFGATNAITATDLNPFLLREAQTLAAAEGLGGAIRFLPANAEALPFADRAFDCAFSVTVLEECDADRALAEIFRVLRPGGRAGIIVRAIDMPQWWHLSFPAALRGTVEKPPQSVGARGVADASLYRRMQTAGFSDLKCFPSLVTLDRPDGPIWRYREDHVRALLSAEESKAWSALTEAARAENLLFMAHPMHCAVGVKPWDDGRGQSA
jgi:ubiquinone/menaquinone biosynthesis C-methylase UbiE